MRDPVHAYTHIYENNIVTLWIQNSHMNLIYCVHDLSTIDLAVICKPYIHTHVGMHPPHTHRHTLTHMPTQTHTRTCTCKILAQINSCTLTPTLVNTPTTHTHTHTYIYIYIYTYLPMPSHWQDVTQGQFFKRSSVGLNKEFSFSSTDYLNKAK